MDELLAGISTGFLMGVISVGIGALLLVSSGAQTKVDAAGDEVKSVSAKLSLGLPILLISLWGFCLGPLFGVSLLIFKRALPLAGAGSSNLPYTISILSLAAVSGAIFLVLRRSRLVEKLLLVVVFALLFGWLLPLLAS